MRIGIGTFTGPLGWLWDNKDMVAVLALAGAFAWLLWSREGLQDDVAQLKKDKALLNTVVLEYENAQRELDGKAEYEKEYSNVAAESAAAVATGRQGGDAPMAPVLRTEYSRVLGLRKKAGIENHP